MRIKVLELISLAADKAFSNEEIAVASHSLVVSYNAEAAFTGYLAAACGVACHRPQLLESLLPAVLDAAVCMGVEDIRAFWQYADHCVHRDEAAAPEFRNFDSASLTFYSQSLRHHEATIARLLRLRLNNVA